MQKSKQRKYTLVSVCWVVQLLQVLERFDCEAFNITPSEASTLDPQQRLLLHTAHDSFTEAGVKLDEVANRKIGIFVGITAVDYFMYSVGQVSKPSAYRYVN